MQPQPEFTPRNDDALTSADDLRTLEHSFSERVGRVSALFELDTALSAAANRYSLAAQVVHFGWPHRAD